MSYEWLHFGPNYVIWPKMFAFLNVCLQKQSAEASTVLKVALYHRLISSYFMHMRVCSYGLSVCFLSHPPTHNHTVLSLSLHSRSIFYCASLCKTALQAIKIQQATKRSAFLFLLHPSLLTHLFLTAGGWRWSGWTLRRRLLQNCCVDWALSVRTLVRSVCLWEYTSHLLLSSCHFFVMYMFSSTALSMNSRANIFRNLTEKCTCLLHLVHHDKCIKN